MNYRRVLCIAELGADASAIAPLVRRMAPAADLLLVVAHIVERKFTWFSGEAPGDLDAAVAASVDMLRKSTAGAAASVEIELAADLDAGRLAELAAASKIDLVVTIGSLKPPLVAMLVELRKRCNLAVLSSARAAASDRPMREIRCEAIGSRARAAVAAFLRDHGDVTMHATVVLLDAHVRDRATALGIAGIESQVDLVPLHAPKRGAIDLLVLARLPGALLGAHSWPAPILILPPLPVRGSTLQRAIDVADLVDDNGVMRVSIHYAGGIGRYAPIPDQPVAFVSAGRVAATITTRNGEGELPPGMTGESFGVFRVGEQMGADPLIAIEQDVQAIRPGVCPLMLFDSELSDGELAMLTGLPGRDHEFLAVRLRPTRSCESIRTRLLRVGLPTRVADASAVLDEGAAFDVSNLLDPVRLARVGARMRGAGFPVVAIVYRGEHPPHTIGFAAMRAGESAGVPSLPSAPVPEPRSLAGRLEATTGAALLQGNRIELEMDNAKARRWLLDAIAASRKRIHLQLYMALDDDVGRPVEAALAAAGARGVTVRVVVDSLHGLEGSFGAHNPLFERLAGRPGVKLLASRPITGVPSLEDVKQRDHRKIAVIDGAIGLLGGRNLSHEYYTGFDEVRLTPHSTWRQVPWLDAGARVEGPAVAALERSFLDAWTVAGGESYEIVEPPAAGSTSVRVVVHHGLRDACTLEAYLALIESAMSHIYAVNGFPLVLELQHALLRAINRGVRVRSVFGNLTPTHSGKPFGGPWSTARTAATELVHSRVDALVAAGGEGYQFAVRQQAGWTEGLGVINPHVHAKVMSVDARVCSVGSANLDVTAGYWENEVMLIVEDAAITLGLEARIDQLIGGSLPVDRNDPDWQRTARHRTWMQHWPGVLSV